MPTEPLRIASDALAAEIAPLGAELRTLSDAQGRDLLWDGDPAFWTGRARRCSFRSSANLQGAPTGWTGAATRCPSTASPAARPSWWSRTRTTGSRCGWTRRTPRAQSTPFDFRLDVSYAITGATLTLTAVVSNLGEAALPASFGFHPAFRWPLPYGEPRADHRLTFAEAEPAPIRRIDGQGLLTPSEHATPVRGRELHLNDALFEDDALIFDRLASRSLTYGAATGPSLEIAFPDMPLLGVWTKPGAGFICVEPWQGCADPQGFDGEFPRQAGRRADRPRRGAQLRHARDASPLKEPQIGSSSDAARRVKGLAPSAVIRQQSSSRTPNSPGM